MSESTRTALPRKHPKNHCPDCGGRYRVNGTERREGWITRWLKCRRCGRTDSEHDEMRD